MLGLTRDWKVVPSETSVAIVANLRRVGLVETKRERIERGSVFTTRARLSALGIEARAMLARSAH